MNLRFAFAVNNDNQFEKKHFGDADKYLIYQEELEKIVLSSEELNRFKLLDKRLNMAPKKRGMPLLSF